MTRGEQSPLAWARDPFLNTEPSTRILTLTGYPFATYCAFLSLAIARGRLLFSGFLQNTFLFLLSIWRILHASAAVLGMALNTQVMHSAGNKAFVQASFSPVPAAFCVGSVRGFPAVPVWARGHRQSRSSPLPQRPPAREHRAASDQASGSNVFLPAATARNSDVRNPGGESAAEAITSVTFACKRSGCLFSNFVWLPMFPVGLAERKQAVDTYPPPPGSATHGRLSKRPSLLGRQILHPSGQSVKPLLTQLQFTDSFTCQFPLCRAHTKNLNIPADSERGFPTSIRKIKLLKSCLNLTSYF